MLHMILVVIQIWYKMDVMEQEQRDAVRVVYNVMPSSKALLGKATIPQALHYTPYADIQCPILESPPSNCSNCGKVLNCYCKIIPNSNQIVCCFCHHHNKLQPNHIQADIKPYLVTEKVTKSSSHSHIKSQSMANSIPKQLTLQYSTFQYKINNKNNKIVKFTTEQGFCFVVDVCLEQKQLEAIKTSILNLLTSLDQNQVKVRVSLITYNKYVYLYDFGSNINTLLCMAPSKKYSLSELASVIGIVGEIEKSASNYIAKKYFVNFCENKHKIMKAISSLKRQGFKTYKHQRQLRASGQALNIAVSLNQLCQETMRVVFLTGGPCTVGVGKIIDVDFKHEMRSINQSPSQTSIQARQFYKELKTKSLSKMITVDAFIFSVEEVGLAEMYQFLASTGGIIIQQEEFASLVFSSSFKKAYSPNIQKENQINKENQIIGKESQIIFKKGIEATIQINCSNEILLNGVLGEVFPIELDPKLYNGFNISQKEVGQGHTYRWFLGAIDNFRTFTLLFDLREVETEKQAFYIQLKTIFTDPQDRQTQICRITTIRRLFSKNLPTVIEAFDQDAALAVLCRLCIYKSVKQNKQNIRQWLDNVLIRWSLVFARYVKGNEQSFTLQKSAKVLPQYVYHLRRNAIVRRSGVSLDELTYLSHVINRETVQNLVTIIQPALLKYTLDEPDPCPVALDQKHMTDEVILILDTYFNVIQWYGENIYSWHQHHYHHMKEYQHLAILIDSPKVDIQYLTNHRFPTPNYYFTHPAHSKERYFKSRVNPNPNQENQNFLTDDADIYTFTKHLIDLVVNQRV